MSSFLLFFYPGEAAITHMLQNKDSDPYRFVCKKHLPQGKCMKFVLTCINHMPQPSNASVWVIATCLLNSV